MPNIAKPTLLLNKDICKANIHRMADKARAKNLAFKPHMKTHQSAEIGEWISDAGAEAVTVSSVAMAGYFVRHGWDNITIAFPVNLRQANEIDELAAKATINLLVNSPEAARTLDKALSHSVNAFIEIDTGSERSGIPSAHKTAVADLISTINKTAKLQWIGFYSHPGHSYQAGSEEEIIQIHNSVIEQFRALRQEFSSLSKRFEICVGDTPCCSAGTDFDGIDSISPGNFVFFDLMQHQIGSCKISDIAVAMACPVVDKYANRNELVIHGGAIHFSKEKLDEGPFTHYGKVASEKGAHWQIFDEESHLKSLSQEHGVVKCSSSLLKQYQIGDVITILPVHSCLTANLMGKYELSDGQVIRQFK